MVLHYFKLTWILALILASISFLPVKPQTQGCSLMGMDLQSCFDPNTKTLVSPDSCCTTLNQAIQAGYYCLCSLLRGSDYSSLNPALSLSFSSCYVSMPPLTHCNVFEARPELAPPATTLPPPRSPLPVLMPPHFPRDDSSVPPPTPKVNEIPLNPNSSIANSTTGAEISSSSLPKLNITERLDCITSDNANVRIMLGTKIMLLLVAFCALSL